MEIQRAPGRVEDGDAAADGSPGTEGDLTTLLPAAAPTPAPFRRDRITPISADAYALEATLDRESHDLLRQIQALQGRGVPAHDIAGVLKRALRLLASELLTRKLGTGTGHARGSRDPHYISPAVKRVVWKRDGGRCTFRGENGKCCGETHDLEFDHITPPSRGGDGAESNVRLRCRAHNQREAERLYNECFMREKREGARHAAAEAKARREKREAERLRERERRDAARAKREARRDQQHAAREARRAERQAACEQARLARAADAAARARLDELVPALMNLGCSRARALQAAAQAGHLPDAPLEQRLRVAIQSLAPRSSRRSA